jgi:hypothetical protein
MKKEDESIDNLLVVAVSSSLSNLNTNSYKMTAIDLNTNIFNKNLSNFEDN